MKRYINQIAKLGLITYHAYKQNNFYKKLLRLNHFPNKEQPGEEAWLKKWSGLGMKVNPVYYRLFYHYIGEDMNIMPEDISHDIVEPLLNPSRFVKYYTDKNIFDRLFPEGYLPRTILRRMNGFWYDAQYRRLQLDDELLIQLLNSSNSDKLIVKPTVEGMSGRNIIMLRREEGCWKHDGLEVSVNMLQQRGVNFIVQECVVQHEYISQFNPTSVNTLRLTLYRSVKTDECVVTSAIMRIGGKGSVVDNAHAGGGYIGINVENGKLCHKVLDQWGRSQDTFNDIDFSKDYILPHWDNVLTFAKTIGDYVPHHRLLALDIVLGKGGVPQILEFNITSYSMWLFQFTIGGALGKYTDEIIEYCKDNQNSLEYQLLI